LIYVFDDNSLSNILNHYYPDRFPSFWAKYAEAISDEFLISVREVMFELREKYDINAIDQFTKYNPVFFSEPTFDELGFITRIYSVSHFRQNLEKKKLLKGGSFADPFIIAKAYVVNGTVVTEEKYKDNAAKIPNICKHFGIKCVNFEGFMQDIDWVF